MSIEVDLDLGVVGDIDVGMDGDLDLDVDEHLDLDPFPFRMGELVLFLPLLSIWSMLSSESSLITGFTLLKGFSEGFLEKLCFAGFVPESKISFSDSN